jgi:hypothetical protein
MATPTPDGTETPDLSIVEVDSITADGSVPAFLGVADDSVITSYIINNRYENDKRVCMMPIASPNGFQGASAAFVQLASPTLLRLVDWTMLQSGDANLSIPDPNPVDPNWVLLDVMPETRSLVVTAGGDPVYRISGTYVYGHRNPPANVFDAVQWGRPPWMADIFERVVNTAEELVQGLADIQGGTGGGGGNPYPGQPGDPGRVPPAQTQR